MAELATIARPYADALFKASPSDARSTGIWLDALAALCADPQLLELAHDPAATTDKVFGFIREVLDAMETQVVLSSQAQNFLHAVIDNKRLGALPEMASQFRAHVNSQSGAADALVYSAFDIDVAALAEVTSALENRFNRKLNVVVQLQPDLIGGIRVVVGDEVLDTSVKAHLEQMKVALAA
ncbi:MAG: F0F1 ATP synthase subunit delta [Betaproteobacteria bacterium]